ncbi:tRNA-intron endonuclease catalytic domain-like protein [Gigaspora margarita]|uniref:tRNA-splicing endonuclease subunit Sen34 n=1 Tax=Gigaspora margarita TaxID=4874 RepID=A0A8H4ACQ5_GIGMA|nr:tRNA-intron endonuclease catalytic domain-like protein [Gigaspora margarita]
MESSKTNVQQPFKVNISKNNKAFIWDAETVNKLRKDRIIGSLIGSLPRYPLQNQLLGLPLSLMPEEVTLLLSKGIIVLIDDEKSHLLPTKSQIEEFEKNKTENEEQQLQDYLRFIKEKRSKFQSLKKNKLKKNDVKEIENITNNDNDHNEIDDSCSQQLRITEHESSLIKAFAPTITIKTSSNSFEWYNDKNYCFDSLEVARLAGLWTWPSTPKEKYKFNIYCDLWNRGYFITNGIKFGGDYLLYPGDPLRYHSHFIATIIDMNKELSPMDIITFGRMGTAVKKSYMLCSWDTNEDKAVYVCIEWAGY